jgi:hypothetical protein
MPGVLTPFGSHLNLIDVFYHQFYPSHPFLPPHMRLIQSLRHNSETLNVLVPAIEYIASFYINIPDNSSFKQNAEQAVLESSSSSPFKLQALLLLAIGNHSSGFRETAEKYINKACDMVAELKLDQMDNNQENILSEISDPVMRESLRRTVWEVFYNDVVLAAFRGDSSQKMWRLLSSTLKLPCSDGDFIMQVSRFSSPLPHHFLTSALEHPQLTQFPSIRKRLPLPRSRSHALFLPRVPPGRRPPPCHNPQARTLL